MVVSTHPLVVSTLDSRRPSCLTGTVC
ncbi:hypothetical protein Taro_043519 [Colocasia esculenta]|uniref:Uncharacterized protein n=1 Tax=Colocasia esculenta TaxID=4460 RepID=A0A843X0V2_COLES|nr:hypothetical protein [Colocasia esculenta]